MALLSHKQESKNIHLTEYDVENKELFVTFKDFRDPKKLTKYKYERVPKDLWEALIVAPSLGQFINQKVKTGPYPYEKV